MVAALIPSADADLGDHQRFYNIMGGSATKGATCLSIVFNANALLEDLNWSVKRDPKPGAKHRFATKLRSNNIATCASAADTPR